MKPLVLSYELAWRTEADERFMKSHAWSKIRFRALEMGNHTCVYCGCRSEKGMLVHHIDGNPKNNDDNNLEIVCGMCNMILHSGFFSCVLGVVELYEESRYSQNEIIQITRRMREEGRSDAETRRRLRLKRPVPWIQDLGYLSRLYGFISSKGSVGTRPPKPLLTEADQRRTLRYRAKW